MAFNKFHGTCEIFKFWKKKYTPDFRHKYNRMTKFTVLYYEIILYAVIFLYRSGNHCFLVFPTQSI